jgi:hypothetical protein
MPSCTCEVLKFNELRRPCYYDKTLDMVELRPMPESAVVFDECLALALKRPRPGCGPSDTGSAESKGAAH